VGADNEEPPLPDVIAGRYKVLGFIGRGGMGHVLDVQDNQTWRRAVAKMLLPQFANDEVYAQRFEREARVMMGIEHPNIVQVFDFGRGDDGQMYIVMEKLQGLELWDLMKRGRLAPKVVRAYGLDVLRALDTAHKAGVVHRDIKPANIFIEDRPGRRPVARVIDFGIASVASEETVMGGGGAVGTPNYMPPEQILGYPLDGRADIYSLSVVLYRALSQRLPHKGRGRDIIKARIKKDPIPLSVAIDTPLPEGLEDVIMKGLTKSAEDRWKDAREMRDALAWVKTRKRR